MAPSGPGCTEGQVFVAPSVDDSAEGTAETPLATLAAARDRARALIAAGRPQGAVTVCVRGGDYFLGESFELGAEGSGEAGGPIVYQAYVGEQVRLVGARAWRAARSPV